MAPVATPATSAVQKSVNVKSTAYASPPGAAVIPAHGYDEARPPRRQRAADNRSLPIPTVPQPTGDLLLRRRPGRGPGVADEQPGRSLPVRGAAVNAPP